MDIGNRLEILLTLAEELGIEIRAEPMGGDGGGLCRLRGRQVLFVDTLADLSTRYDRTLTAMSSLSELEERYVVPEVRQDLERARRGAAADDQRLP
jgi:hypothetical protein